MHRRFLSVTWMILLALTLGSRGPDGYASGDDYGTLAWPAEQAVEGYFAERPWYGELVSVLADNGTTASRVARELAVRHAEDRLVLEAIADWIDQDLRPETRIRPLVPSSQAAGQTWRYTTDKPAEGWYEEEFDDAAWAEGLGGFGTRGTPGAVVRTPWTTEDIWLRRTFELDAEEFTEPHLLLHHDEDAVVYLNGKQIARFSGYVREYFTELLSAEARRLLRPGRNTLAVSCHQTSGGQYIDVGLIDIASQAAVGRAEVAKVLSQISTHGDGGALAGLQARFNRLAATETPPGQDWAELYLDAATVRRAVRLGPYREALRQVVFAKHFNMGGSHYAYTEGQSDAQHERHFYPGSALCLLELDGPFPKIRTLIDDPDGVIRNPDVSYDGSRILFAWKKSDREDDYHLYEMDVATGQIRQLTFGLGFADYEGVYLPNGDILFNSTRCVQTVDCFWTEVSNLYTCDPDGNFLRRLTFDQVHTNFPTLTEDGRVLYTRWDYNDRGQLFPQPLFQMFPDGTGQTEFYGNNSWFPTTIKHARGIPGTQKVLAVATGHHSFQAGKLCLIDPARGRQEDAGVQLIAPVRETRAERIDAYGQTGDLFQYPYPLSETEYLLTYHPEGWPRRGRPDQFTDPKFAIYWMTIDGHRELLASDPNVPATSPSRWRRAGGLASGPARSITGGTPARFRCRTSTPAWPWTVSRAARSDVCESSRWTSEPRESGGFLDEAPGGRGIRARPSLWAMEAGTSRWCWAMPKSTPTVRPCSKSRRARRCTFKHSISAATRSRPCAAGPLCSRARVSRAWVATITRTRRLRHTLVPRWRCGPAYRNSNPSMARPVDLVFPMKSSRSSTATASYAITTGRSSKAAWRPVPPTPSRSPMNCERSACWANLSTTPMPNGFGAMPI
jgi:hypothetical protein